jgi:predicted amidophosphoribosyltransferase
LCGYPVCKNLCKKLKGYEKGYRHFNSEGKRYCATCDYKIKTEAARCPCCKTKYRVRNRKNYFYLDYEKELQGLIVRF